MKLAAAPAIEDSPTPIRMIRVELVPCRHASA